MRRLLAVALVAGLIFASTTGLPGAADETNENPGSSGDPGEPQRIGAYQRVVGSDDLTLDHVGQTENGIRVKGPSLTSTLRVESGFLDAELGPGWGASQAFTIDGDEIVVPARSVAFEPLQLGSDPVFTMGADDQIAFQERPMWISVEQPGYGDQITLEMDDGDTQGQQVFISKEWLWDRGIHRPHVVHEDGTNLTAVATEERDGWMIEMHHFSYIAIHPTDNLVMARQNGVVTPHFDTVLLYDDNMRIEIDVDNHHLGTYEVLIDKDWADMKLVLPAPQDHDWFVDVIDGDDYYVIGLSPSQTPTTIFVRTEVVLVDSGNGAEMFTGELLWDEQESRLEIDIGQSSSNVQVLVNKNWTDQGIEYLALLEHTWTVEKVDGNDYYQVGLTGEQTPTTLVFTDFDPSDGLAYTRGNPETAFLFNPMMIEVTTEPGAVHIDHEFTDENYFPVSSVMMNVSWLIANGVEKPRIQAGEWNTTTYAVMEGALQYSIDFSQAPSSSIQNDDSAVGSLFAELMEMSKCKNHLGLAAEIVAELDDDYDSGGSGYIYMLGATFCFEWEVHVPQELWDEWDEYTIQETYFSAAYGIWDPNTGLACGDGTENNKEFTGKKGWATCTWDHAATLPSDLKYSLMVSLYANLKEDVELSTNTMWACVGAGTATALGAAAVMIWNPPAALVAGTVSGVVATAIFCGVMVWEAKNVVERCCEIHTKEAQVMTTNGYIHVPDTTFWLDLGNQNSRRVDTWDLVEETFGDQVRSDVYDGEQIITWMVENVDFGEILYEPDISILYGNYHYPSSVDFGNHEIGRDVGVNYAIFEAKQATFSDPAEILIGSPSSDLRGIDWQAPNSLCTLEMEIISTLGKVKILPPGEYNSVLCPGVTNEGIFVPPIDDPEYPNLGIYDTFPDAPKPLGVDDVWIEFVANAPELGVHDELLNISIQDVLNANSSLPKAYAIAVFGEGEFADTVENVTVIPMNESDAAVGGWVETCEWIWEDPHVRDFRVGGSGSPVFGNIQEVSDRSIQETLICFDPTTISMFVEG